MSGDLSKNSIEEVNAELERMGFTPQDVRALAWNLVKQELRDPLPWRGLERIHGLKLRLWQIIDVLTDAGATPEDFRRACAELADEITKRNA